MTAVKKKLLIALVCVAMLFAGIAIFSACNGDSGDLKVTFMVQDDATGQWQQYAEEDVVDGSVTIPNAPGKDYYTFGDWYYNADFSGDVFTGRDITESINVYARYIPDEVTIVINGENLGSQNLVDVVNGTYDPGENLEFDGWYTDSNYNVEWVVGDEAQTLYARSVARISFHNGYEEVWSTTIEPGTILGDPKVETNSAGETWESAEIVEWYMDSANVYYVDKNGNTIDFTTFAPTENTTITVLWASPLEYNEYGNEGNYYVSGIKTDRSSSLVEDEDGNPIEDYIEYNSRASLPVISILSDVVMTNEDGQKQEIHVDNVSGFSLSNFSNLETIVIGEGIKCIQNSFRTYLSMGGVAVQNVELPSSLVILENSFLNCPQITSVELPQGLEVLINCFTVGYKQPIEGLTIKVPSSVKNIAQLTTNFDFSANDRFYYDNENRLFQRGEDGKEDILITDPNVADGELIVPEGVSRIQVGAFMNLQIENLVLPTTWTEVCYNAEASQYDFYLVNSQYSTLYVSTESPADSMAAAGIAVFAFSKLNDMDTVRVRSAVGSFADSISEYAIVGGSNTASETIHKYDPYTDSEFADMILFTGPIDAGTEASVRITYSHNFIFDAENEKMSGKVTTKIVSGNKLSEADIFKALNLTDEYINGEVEIISVSQFGDALDLNEVVSTNLYIDVVWGYTASAGFTYEENSSGGITVTGLDTEHAYLMKDYNGYLLQIPESVNGKPVTEIKDDAFNGDNGSGIYAVSIPSTVVKIGDRAFKGITTLTQVYIAPGGLQVIGESAFEGCSIVSIALPVSNLTEVGAYAFKMSTLATFETAAGEENRTLYTVGSGNTSILYEGIKEGMFFIFDNRLVRFVSTETVSIKDPITGGTTQVKVYDVQLIAVAGGEKGINTSNPYVFGYSERNASVSFAGAKDCVVRYEIMTGSVYYLNNYRRFVFGIISKVHENAFTDTNSVIMTGSSSRIYYSVDTASVYDSWVTLEQLQNLDSEIFEEGWWNGITSSDEEYESTFKTWKTGRWSVFTSLY